MTNPRSEARKMLAVISLIFAALTATAAIRLPCSGLMSSGPPDSKGLVNGPFLDPLIKDDVSGDFCLPDNYDKAYPPSPLPTNVTVTPSLLEVSTIT